MSKLVEKTPSICVKKSLQQKPFYRRTFRLIGYKHQPKSLYKGVVWFCKIYYPIDTSSKNYS